jgi:hypothetical protein
MKYYLSIIAIFKNESQNFKEWMQHYLWQGVEHFYLIDNGSTDDNCEILQDYFDIVEVHERKLRYKQVLHYNEFYDIAREETEWVGVVDLDEFIFGTEEPLKKYLENRDHAISVMSNWLHFASKDEYNHPKSIRKAFTYRWCQPYKDGKCFSKPKKFNRCHIHSANHADGSNSYHIDNFTHGIHLCDNEKLKNNHYPIQSKEWYEKVKMTRGDVAAAYLNNHRNWDYFNKMDQRCVVDSLLSEMVTKLEHGIDPYKQKEEEND